MADRALVRAMVRLTAGGVRPQMTLSLVLLLALAAACGGGGGGGGAPPPPPVNHAPIAQQASLSVVEDGSLAIVLVGTDADGDALTFQVAPPSHGTLEGTAPNLTYRPTPLFHGGDTFTFTVSDGRLASSPATVQIEVTHVNHPPSASDGQAMSLEDGSVTFVLAGADPDADPLAFAVATPPVHGALVLAGASATYTPVPMWHGTDAFTFTVSDGLAESAPATVTLEVVHVNHAPLAGADQAVTGAGRPAAIDVLANDSDPDGDALVAAVTLGPAHGTAVLEAGRVRYTPAAGWIGDDGFTYEARDPAGSAAAAQVTVHVLAPGSLASTTAIGGRDATGSAGLSGLAPLADGSFVVAGTFTKGLALGAVPSVRGLSAGDTDDAFVARFLPDGRLAWSRWISSGGWCQIGAMAALPDGSVAVGGRFSGPLTLDVGDASQTTLDTVTGDFNDFDAFLVLYGPDGTRRWAKVLGGTVTSGGGDAVTALAAAPDGTGLLAAVSLAAGGTLGQGEPAETTFTGRTVALARYRLGGTLAWSTPVLHGAFDAISSVALAGDGTSFATGFFAGTAVFGVGAANETTLVAPDDADVFLARYAGDGAFDWVRHPLGANRDEGMGVALTPGGTGLVLAGRFAYPPDGVAVGTITFGAGEAAERTLTSAGGGDPFLAGYSTDGTFSGWATSAGGAGWDLARGVMVLPDGSAVVLDDFQGNQAVLGRGEPGQVTFSSVSVVLARLGPTGLLQWASAGGGVTCHALPVLSPDGSFLLCPGAVGTQLVLAAFIP